MNGTVHRELTRRRGQVDARALEVLNDADPRPLGLSELSLAVSGSERAAGNLRRVLHRLSSEGLVAISRQPSGRGPAINVYAITAAGKTALRKRRAENAQTEAAINARVSNAAELYAAVEQAREELGAARDRYEHELHEAIAAGATYEQLARCLSETLGIQIDAPALVKRVSRYARSHGTTVGTGRRRTSITDR